jgi:hypothetical protein
MGVSLDETHILTSGGGTLWIADVADICPLGFDDDVPLDDDLNVDYASAVQIGVTTGTVELSIDAPINGIPTNELPGMIKPYLGDTKATIKFNHVSVFQPDLLALLPSICYTTNSTRNKIYGARRSVNSTKGCIFVCEQDVGVFVFVLYKAYFSGPLVWTLGKNEYAKPSVTAMGIPVATRAFNDQLYQAYVTTP